MIGGAGYAASVAFSDGGFKNWNPKQFVRSIGMGALSGAITYGIGSFFGPVGNMGITGEFNRALCHGFANGYISVLNGGYFEQGFLSGSLSSIAGSAFMMYGGPLANNPAGTYVFSGLAGGAGSVLTGGDFCSGFAIGLMNAGLNHLQHVQQESTFKFFEKLRQHYHKGNGKDYILSSKEFHHLRLNGKIDFESATRCDDGTYNARINFYGCSPDLKYSFGKSLIKYKVGDDGVIRYVGFFDEYNFNPLPWGTRSTTAEVITRLYSILKGTNYYIYYGDYTYEDYINQNF